MNEEKIIEIIKQVLHNPQVSPPPISYEITDKDMGGGRGDDYYSQYIDLKDFESYVERLEAQLIYRFTK